MTLRVIFPGPLKDEAGRLNDVYSLKIFMEYGKRKREIGNMWIFILAGAVHGE